MNYSRTLPGWVAGNQYNLDTFELISESNGGIVPVIDDTQIANIIKGMQDEIEKVPVKEHPFGVNAQDFTYRRLLSQNLHTKVGESDRATRLNEETINTYFRNATRGEVCDHKSCDGYNHIPQELDNNELETRIGRAYDQLGKGRSTQDYKDLLAGKEISTEPEKTEFSKTEKIEMGGQLAVAAGIAGAAYFLGDSNEPAQGNDQEPQKEQSWFRRNANWVLGLPAAALVLEVAYTAFINKNHKPVLGKFTALFAGNNSNEVSTPQNTR